VKTFFLKTDLIRFVFSVFLTGATLSSGSTDTLALNNSPPLSKLFPTTIEMGPDVGFTGNQFITSTAYENLILPTTKVPGSSAAFSWGGTLKARWGNHISLALSPHRETYRVSTQVETVSFANNPFAHTLQSSTEFSYNYWPVALGYTWRLPHQYFQIELGIFQAFLDTHSIEWTVDGQNQYNLPELKYQNVIHGWSMGFEYAHQLGIGQMFIGMDAKRNSESMATGLDGSIKVVSARIHMGYLWAFPLSLY